MTRTDGALDPVRELFEALNAGGVQYVVPRGYLPVTELYCSGDIDVFVAPTDFRRLAEIAGSIGWLRRRHQWGRYPHVFFDSLGWKGQFATVLDVVTGLAFGPHGHELVDPQPILERGEPSDFLRVPDPWHAAFLLTLHILLDKAQLEPHHVSRLRRHWDLCQGGASNALREDFGERAEELVRRVIPDLLQVESPEIPMHHRQAARMLPQLRARRARSWWRWNTIRVQRRLARPLRVGVVGIDGSGKGTLIQKLSESAWVLPVSKTYLGYNDFETWWFRKILSLMDRFSSPANARQMLLLRILDALRRVAWPLELRTRMWRAERGKVLVFYDRFPLPAEPSPAKWLGGRLLQLFVRASNRAVPRADVLLFLDGDVEEIWRRKQEYPLEVAARVHEEYRLAVEATSADQVVVRTDCSIQDSVDESVAKITAAPSYRRRLYFPGPR